MCVMSSSGMVLGVVWYYGWYGVSGGSVCDAGDLVIWSDSGVWCVGDDYMKWGIGVGYAHYLRYEAQRDIQSSVSIVIEC